MHQATTMSHEQVLPFLFTPETQRRPEDVAAWHEALRQAQAEQETGTVCSDGPHSIAQPET